MSTPSGHTGGATFSSDQLPANLVGEARVRAFQEVLEYCGSFETRFALDRPFSAEVRWARFGIVTVDRFSGPLILAARTRRHVADGNDDFFFGVSSGVAPVMHRQMGREVVHPAGAATLLSLADPGEAHNDPRNGWVSVHLPRARVLELVPGAEDLVARRLDSPRPALGHVRRYVDFLLQSAGNDEGPALNEYVGTTLVDLVALCLGAAGDSRDLACGRGLRAARLREAVDLIRKRFADPAFSVGSVAKVLGVGERYVQELLHGSGATFSQRVLELRLQAARSMLARAGYDGMKVIDVALACGFNDVSYFNRCFRRRFGDSPTAYRARQGRSASGWDAGAASCPERQRPGADPEGPAAGR